MKISRLLHDVRLTEGPRERLDDTVLLAGDIDVHSTVSFVRHLRIVSCARRLLERGLDASVHVHVVLLYKRMAPVLCELGRAALPRSASR